MAFPEEEERAAPGKNLMNTITLTTDFGDKDWFTGAVKGVILSTFNQASIVDISHNLKSFDIKSAAFFLKNFYATFPKKTIHCIIVDPTVGSMRKIIAIETENYYFIAPDNGILSYVLQEEKILKCINIPLPKKTSSTFHGRDIFAPAAATLAKEKNINALGSILEAAPVIFEIKKPIVKEKYIEGEVIFIDKFGNIILNINNDLWSFFRKNVNNDFFNLQNCGKNYILKQVNTYADSNKNDLLFIAGSCGNMEIALNQGNAAKTTDIKVGNTLKIEHRK